jgi:ComEC/Rec2-related protein
VHSTEAQGILHALLLGDCRAMDQEVMQSYSRSGTIHILAVSGLHVGMIYLLISFVFGKVLLRNSWPLSKMLVQASLLWMYAGLTDFSPSVSRSAVMCTFFIIASAGKKQSNAINTLAASAVLQAAHDPLSLLSLGFQLSYLAVLGILLLQLLALSFLLRKIHHHANQILFRKLLEVGFAKIFANTNFLLSSVIVGSSNIPFAFNLAITCSFGVVYLPKAYLSFIEFSPVKPYQNGEISLIKSKLPSTVGRFLAKE